MAVRSVAGPMIGAALGWKTLARRASSDTSIRGSQQERCLPVATLSARFPERVLLGGALA
jgi:hypothetical protein